MPGHPFVGDRRHGFVRLERGGADDRAFDREATEPLVGVRHRRGRRREVEVDDEQLGLELPRPAEHGAGGVDHDRVAVEDQLVLSTDEVHVCQHALALAGPACAQRQAYVVLVGFVGRAIGHDEQGGVGCLGGSRRSVAPQVLADGERDVDATDLDDVDRVAGHEVADLVADAVVPEVVLGLPGHDLAAVHDRDGVGGRVLGDADLLGDVLRLVEEADHRHELSAAFVLQTYGKVFGGRARCPDQRCPHREILDGVSRQHHLGEHDEVDALGDRLLAVVHDEVGVGAQIADGGVDLGKGESHLGHVPQRIQRGDPPLRRGGFAAYRSARLGAARRARSAAT